MSQRGPPPGPWQSSLLGCCASPLRQGSSRTKAKRILGFIHCSASPENRIPFELVWLKWISLPIYLYSRTPELVAGFQVAGVFWAHWPCLTRGTPANESLYLGFRLRTISQRIPIPVPVITCLFLLLSPGLKGIFHY